MSSTTKVALGCGLVMESDRLYSLDNNSWVVIDPYTLEIISIIDKPPGATIEHISPNGRYLVYSSTVVDLSNGKICGTFKSNGKSIKQVNDSLVLFEDGSVVLLATGEVYKGPYSQISPDGSVAFSLDETLVVDFQSKEQGKFAKHTNEKEVYVPLSADRILVWIPSIHHLVVCNGDQSTVRLSKSQTVMPTVFSSSKVDDFSLVSGSWVETAPLEPKFKWEASHCTTVPVYHSNRPKQLKQEFIISEVTN